MSREIEFRCYLKDSALEHLNSTHFEKHGRMFDVVSLDFEYQEVEINTPSMIGVSFADVELLQFTGLRDRNGTKIFEGDILCGDKEKNIRPVFIKYEPTRAGFEAFLSEDELSWMMLSEASAKTREVIGNIYESPELLNPTIPA